MLLNPIPFLNFSVSPKSDADIQKPADIPIGKNKIECCRTETRFLLAYQQRYLFFPVTPLTCHSASLLYFQNQLSDHLVPWLCS